MIIGIDEVGRGCWAGPLMACAVVLPEGFYTPESVRWRLDDSKRLSAAMRRDADRYLRDNDVLFAIGSVTAAELDSIGMTKSVAMAMTRAYMGLPKHCLAAGEVIIDGSINYLSELRPDAKAVIKADGSVPAVSAASIIAKVARDEYMQQADADYPGYGFATHVGYGTLQHRQALERLGTCALHRRSFKPIAAMYP